MSNQAYINLWNSVQDDLEQVLIEEELFWGNIKQQITKEIAYMMISKLYLKYLKLMEKLDLCYDQIVHPQKRILIRRVLDTTIGRLLQLKQQMVDLDKSDFQFIDDAMLELKMTPLDMEIPIPKYFRLERLEMLKEREEKYNKIMVSLGQEEPEEIKMSLDTAVLLIQMNERARQGRLRHSYMFQIREQDKRSKMKMAFVPKYNPDEASTKIQTLVRGFLDRRKVRRMRREEDIFIGMIPPPRKASPPQERLREIEASRRLIQKKHEEEYQKSLLEVRDFLVLAEGPSMKEVMQDDIRDWFIASRERTGAFPDYPSDDEGGSYVIFHPPPKPTSPGAKKGKKDKKGKKEEDKKKKKKDEPEVFQLESSLFSEVFRQQCKEYTDIWKWLDESDNRHQNHVVELVKDLKRPEVEAELRLVVDALMRVELEQLKDALDRDSRKKKKKKKKKKKGKKGGKKKGRKEKDLTPDRTLDSLYEELVVNGIIKKYPHVNLEDFFGETSYSGQYLRLQNLNPLPALGDIRRVVSEYGVLSVGCLYAHTMLPLIKSVLLAGPSGSGKHMLLHGVCTQLGAVLFDLSPGTIAGKYPGKAGLQMLLHMVIKVGRLMQPSVIMIDGAERNFQKRVPKTDKTDPKRIKKDLVKMLKSITASDQIILIGLATRPWEAEAKGLGQAYNRMILVPPPDYAARHIMWKTFVNRIVSDADALIDYSLLAKVSDKYTPGTILKVVKEVLTQRRILQIKYRPLTSAEIVEALSEHLPVFKEEEDTYNNWLSKTPMGKKRMKMLLGTDDVGAKGKGKEKGKK